MPRQPRLDTPGALHHVMGRGIDGIEIFGTRKDRGDFLDRLKDLYKKDAFNIYAWALMSNHFHLLVRTVRKKDVGSKTTYEFTDLFKIVHYKMFLFV